MSLIWHVAIAIWVAIVALVVIRSIQTRQARARLTAELEDLAWWVALLRAWPGLSEDSEAQKLVASAEAYIADTKKRFKL